LENLRFSERGIQKSIVKGVEKVLTREDPRFIDKVSDRFPMDPLKRRWYDKDPYLWLVINSLLYTDRRVIDEVVVLINTILESGENPKWAL
jgi:hypothetical protein